jgi:hypothetical protein
MEPSHRFTILAMLAMAILTVRTATIPSHTVGMTALTIRKPAEYSPTACSTTPTLATPCVGQPGDVATTPARRPATANTTQ